MKNAWRLDIRDDLFALQHPEDGSEFTASTFYVIAVNDVTGRCFAHGFAFPSAKLVDGEEGLGIASFRDEALARAEKLLKRIVEAQERGEFTTPIGRRYWREIQPVYGSQAYVAQQPEIVAQEKQDALEAEGFV